MQDIDNEGEHVFCTEDVIIYGGYSVCKITEITQKELDSKMVDYYVLKPIFNSGSTVFVPVNNEVLRSRMHTVICKEDACELISSMPDIEEIWIDRENDRKERYKAILSKRDRNEVIGLIKALHIHQQQQAEKKRRLHISDERFLKEAEKTLCEELGFVLDMAPEDVPEMIRRRYNQSGDKTPELL